MQKDVHVPNKGREASSYFWWIKQNYSKIQPGDLIAFVQGNPAAHCDQLPDFLAHGTDWFLELGGWRVICDRQGRPHHGDLPIAQSCKDWLGFECPEWIVFVAGGQFMVTGSNILSRPKSFYEEMFGAANAGDGPWVLERLWALLFGKDS